MNLLVLQSFSSKLNIIIEKNIRIPADFVFYLFMEYPLYMMFSMKNL